MQKTVNEGNQRNREPEEAETAAEPAPAGTAQAEAPSPEAEVASLKAALEATQAEAERLKDERLRALAEVENTRRRAARDRQDASQYAIAGFARDLLAVADNLQRALQSVTAEARQNDPHLDALMSGVEATERSLLSIFERHGINPIAAEGAPFDPHVHEAMFEIPDSSVAHGTVVQVLEVGYTIHDRTLRPARVGIASGGPRGAPDATPEGGEDKLAFPSGGGYGQGGGAAAPGSRVDERT
jgi:molecular chaperone GrpE